MREYIVLTHPQANQKVVICIDDITDIEPYRRFNGKLWEWQSLVHIRNTSRAIEVFEPVDQIEKILAKVVTNK